MPSCARARGDREERLTHIEDIQVRAAIEKLPEWPWPAKIEQQQKTEVA